VDDARLQAIENREKAAVVGPWEYHSWASDYPDHGSVVSTAGGVVVYTTDSSYSWDRDDHNGAFIAHARQDIPDLVAEVKLLRQVIADQQQESALYDAGYAAGYAAGRKHKE
jgi:hypothetical protein